MQWLKAWVQRQLVRNEIIYFDKNKQFPDNEEYSVRYTRNIKD